MRVLLRILALSTLFISFSSHAIVSLELTQGKSSAIPIAINNFANEEQAMADGQQTVSQIIRNDLQNSGEFKIKASGMDDVVTGTVTPVSSSKYQLSFQLQNAFNKTTIASETITVSQSGLRPAAHYFSDVIYQKLTGVRGIFSTKIAYVLVQRNAQGARYTLEVSDMDGFNPRPLMQSSQPIMSPTWSPNGKQIAYVSFENNQSAIYLQDVGSGSRSVVSHSPGINGAPAFSPDGRQLALVLTLSGNPKIYTYSLGSHQTTQLTQGYSIDTEPSWSSDGRSILYTSDSGGNPQIYRYDFNTRQSQRVTFDGNYNARASYLPGGKGIIMMHRGRESQAFGIAKQDFESGRVQILAQATGDESPCVAPNGKMVIYATKSNGRGMLGIVSTDGKIRLNLPERQGDIQEPAWSPFA